MDKTLWLIYAFAAVWLAFGLYIFMLSRRQAKLEKRLRRLEERAPEAGEGDGH
ncbi:MAG: CcmD family protein [Deltaproteobacteria bacterium]|nr:CcmD family protein [Deltaproteobacteria bacterium]